MDVKIAVKGKGNDKISFCIDMTYDFDKLKLITPIDIEKVIYYNTDFYYTLDSYIRYTEKKSYLLYNNITNNIKNGERRIIDWCFNNSGELHKQIVISRNSLIPSMLIFIDSLIEIQNLLNNKGK